MGKVIIGTKGLKGGRQVRAQGGPRRMRCPNCQQLAVPAIDSASGEEVLRCGGCGKQFKTKAM